MLIVGPALEVGRSASASEGDMGREGLLPLADSQSARSAMMKSSSVSRFFLFFVLRFNGSAGAAAEIAGDEAVDRVGDVLGTEEGPAVAGWKGSTFGSPELDKCPLMRGTNADIPGVPGVCGAGECLCSCCIGASWV